MNLPQHPTDFERNPKFLLHTPPSGPLSIYHGRVGAVIRQGGSFITSPNTSLISEPPLGGDRSVFLRSDFRYGDDDHLQWPQPLTPSIFFLSAIPAISDDSHPLAAMSHDLFRSDFTQDQNDLLAGIGKITDIKLDELSTLSSCLLDRAEKFSQSGCPAVTLSFVHEYSDLLRRYLYRLKHITTDFSNTRFTFRGLQRVYLYLHALLDWEEVFYPRLLTNKEGAGVQVSPVIGAFTTDAELADNLYRMGIPVWLVRPFGDLVNARVRALASPILPAQALVLAPSRYKPFSIFKGQNNDRLMYGAIMYQLHTHTRYPNPFGQDIAPMNPLAPPLLPSPSSSSSSSAPRRGSSQKARRHVPYSNHKVLNPQPGNPGRDKFNEPDTTTGILPPALPLWAAALRNVNQHGLPSYHLSHDSLDLSYVLPEPASFLSTQNPNRRTSMINTWLRFRSALLWRLTNGTSKATPMPARVWKDFLGVSFIESNLRKPVDNKRQESAGGSRSSKTLRFAQDFYRSLLDEEGVSVVDNSQPQAPSPPVTWQGKPFDTLVESDIQEIIWEINELSFRFEFMALDSRYSSDANQPFHQDDLDNCFPAATGSLLVVDIAKANSGMASSVLTERSRALLAIQRVMQRWNNSPPPLITTTHAIAWLDTHINELEQVIAQFYTQSFFDAFHRAAIIPRWLPHLPQTILPSPFRHTMMNPRPNVYYDLSILDRGT